MSSGAVTGANPESEKIASYPLFDWLRFLLASIVVLGHTKALPPGPINGGLAVDVFFALSGWLIGGILLRTQRAELPRFFFNRATRIWIPYLAAVILLYSIAVLREGTSIFWFKYLFYDVTFTHNLFTIFPAASQEMPLKGSGNQFWSIGVEEQFYLFAPVIMFLVPAGKRIWPWLVVATGCLILGTHAAPITLGVIAAILQRDFGDWHVKPVARLALLLVAAATLGSLFIWQQTSLSVGLRSLFAISVVLLCAVEGERRTVAVFAGGISFPLYLNHWLPLAFTHGAMKNYFPVHPTVEGVIAYIGAVAFSVVAYWLIDRQILARRQQWYSHTLAIRLAVTAYVVMAIGIIGGILIALR